jgi:hypothetical protein
MGVAVPDSIRWSLLYPSIKTTVPILATSLLYTRGRPRYCSRAQQNNSARSRGDPHQSHGPHESFYIKHAHVIDRVSHTHIHSNGLSTQHFPKSDHEQRMVLSAVNCHHHHRARPSSLDNPNACAFQNKHVGGFAVLLSTPQPTHWKLQMGKSVPKCILDEKGFLTLD